MFRVNEKRILLNIYWVDFVFLLVWAPLALDAPPAMNADGFMVSLLTSEESLYQ